MTDDDASNTDGYPFPGMQQRTALEWLMATDDGTAIDSWHWLIESSTTSFYVKSLNQALEGAKVSIHGPDDNHPGEDHFRFDLIRTDGETLDQKAADKAARAGGRWLTDPNEMPHYFTGRSINDHVKLVVRFSTPWDAFIAGAPPAGGSRWPKAKAMKGLMPVPTKGRVRHVDLYLSTNAGALLALRRTGPSGLTRRDGFHYELSRLEALGSRHRCGQERGNRPSRRPSSRDSVCAVSSRACRLGR